jgi:hypothetical protein
MPETPKQTFHSWYAEHHNDDGTLREDSND